MKKRLLSFLLVAVMVLTMMPITASAAEQPDKVQLWDGGPYWAKTNIGATKSEDSGYYFWWGDTVGYKRNTGNNGWVESGNTSKSINFYLDNSTANKSHNKNKETLISEGWIGENGILKPEHDAATQKWGSDWRMPTESEWKALIDNCYIEYTENYNNSGVKGFVVYKVKNENDKKKFKEVAGYTLADTHIFLPGAGVGSNADLADFNKAYYWSSEFDSIHGSGFLFYGVAAQVTTISVANYVGYPIRPVSDVPNTFKVVTYNANNADYGSVPTDTNKYSSGANVTVLDNSGSLEKDGYYFDGWNTKADGTGTTYKTGATFAITADTTLYAKWVIEKINRDAPEIEISNNYTYGQETALPDIIITPSSFEDNPIIKIYYNDEPEYQGALEWKDITSKTLDAGTYYLFVELSETEKYNKCTTDMIILTVLKAETKVTAPTGKNLVYNGQEQEIINEGSAEGGSMLYSLDGKTYSSDIPTAKEVGVYNVYYKVDGDINHEDVEPKTITAIIDEANNPLPPTPKCVVSFNTNNGLENGPKSQIIEIRSKATEPEEPQGLDGAVFAGWYTDKNCTDGKEYDFDTVVTTDITLYAKWKALPAPGPDPEPPVEVYYAPLIADLKANEEGVIEWKAGDSLPLEAVKLLVEKPELSLEFTFIYEGEEHTIFIPAGAFEQYYDVTIPWYGPAWLIQYFEKPEKEVIVYIIQKDDTLNALAEKYKCTVEEILALNPYINDSHWIYPNNKLLIPVQK